MDQLMTDLFRAYYDARKNKRNSENQLKFELKLEKNLFTLYHEITTRTYKILPSTAFITFKPVQREIIAADFRDRVIHHLVINYLNPLYEPMLTMNSCCGRKGKGTLYGTELAKRFMRACSGNNTRDCYILKLDIKGYFMTMNRSLLYEKLLEIIATGEHKAAAKGETLNFDPELMRYLLKLIVFNNPHENCVIKGSRSDWVGLPPTKSLFHSPHDCGFPIGNLTSQVFSNIYLHELDCFVKYTLGLKYYVRYADDFLIMHESERVLEDTIKVLDRFLKEKLKLELHPDKILIQHYSKGIEFLNAFIKPHRTYVRDRTKSQAYNMLYKWNEYFDALDDNQVPPKKKLEEFRNQVNSYLGFMVHQNTYKLRRKMLLEILSPKAFKYVYVANLRKVVVKRKWKRGRQ